MSASNAGSAKIKGDKKRRNEEKEENLQKDENEDRNLAFVPPNGGWGWVVVLCAFYCNVVVDGIQLTFGIFLRPISKTFKAENSQVALAGSLMFGIHLLMGPICAGFNNVFGLRPVTITGSLICCFGVGISYFSTSHWYLYFSFGILGGIGLGLVYMNSLVITSLYFTSFLPIAIGIVVCGTGVGTIVFAALGSFLLSVTTWQNLFLMEAALAGSMGIAATAFKPIKPVRVRLSSSSRLDSLVDNSESEEDGGPSQRSEKKTSLFIKAKVPKHMSHTSIETLQSLVWNIAETFLARDLQAEEKKSSNCSNCCRKKIHKLSDKEIIELSKIKADNGDASRKSYIKKSFKHNEEDEDQTVERQHSSISYTSIFTRIAVEEKTRRRNFWQSLKKSVITMTDCGLLRSCSFSVFTLSGAINVAATLVVFIYEKERIKDLGFPEESTIYFFITLGSANVFWRLSLGSFSVIPNMNFKAFSICGIVTGGAATVASGYYPNIYFQFLFCFLFGLAMASFAVFRMVFLVELVGVERVSTATGINLMFMGVFSIVCPPIFGYIMEATKNFSLVFSITGTLIITSGLMLINLKKVN